MKGKKPLYKRPWFIVFEVVVFIILMVIIFSGGDDDAPQDTSNSKPSGRVNIGEEGKLYLEGDSEIAVCWTKDYFDAMIDSAVAKDKIGWQQLFLNGKCYLAPANTKVLVLDSSWGAKKFRFLEGDFYAETSWTNMEYIIPIE